MTFLLLLWMFGGDDLDWSNFKPHAVLPPEHPWQGASESLMLAEDHEWATAFEVSGGMDSPDYEQTVAFLHRLAQASDRIHLGSLGRSLEGRDIPVVYVGKFERPDPESLRKTGLPTVLVQAGIHSGEIDGKDAGLMLIRDMAVLGNKAELMDLANLVFIPILNPDGHERRSAFNRMNQRGPSEMGWRTNRRNLNLNRDYTKLETVEVQGLVDWLNRFNPDFYVDIHVTDGMDYRYDVTYGFMSEAHAFSPSLGKYLRETWQPPVDKALKKAGHIPGPMIFPADPTDYSKGFYDYIREPRFSHVYGDVRGLATVLVENHSLKPYKQRVLGTYVFLEAGIRSLTASLSVLRKASATAANARPERLPLVFKPADSGPRSLAFLGVEGAMVDSPTAGQPIRRWSPKPETSTVPFISLDTPVISVDRPRGYYIPATWPEVIARLQRHGIQMEILGEPTQVTASFYRIQSADLDDMPFEGRVRVSASFSTEQLTETLPPGSVYVDTDQPLGNLAILLLEPTSPDSFFQWGYFHEILSRTEYYEVYVMAPIAEWMIKQKPELEQQFQAALAAEPDQYQGARARLDWFYKQSPYYDRYYNLYPIGRKLR